MNQDDEFKSFISGLDSQVGYPDDTKNTVFQSEEGLNMKQTDNHIGNNDESISGDFGNETNHINNEITEGEKTEESSGGKRKLNNSEGIEDGENLNGSEESPSKKQALDIRKMLPELEKHWKPVEDDPSDFNSWTFLLQYVDQENQLLPAREAFDAFLARYSYCYGYWKKYADFEKRNGTAEECEQIFRRGLKAIPLSVDLWIHYLNYVKSTNEDNQEFIRSHFNESVAACGIEFRSDKLWEHYIHWENEIGNMKNVLALYDQVISIPTQSHLTHFQNLKIFIEENLPEDILSDQELTEVKESLTSSETSNDENTSDLTSRIREKVLEKRTEVYKKNEEEVNARWSFEEAIKRPYFHVKPLEKGQLKMWKEYLDFEIERGNEKRIYILFERCLIACALYEEYWIKYITYLEGKENKDIDLIRNTFVRGCTIYHQNKLWLNLYWCAFEESQDNLDKVNELFDKLEINVPDSLHVYFKRIHFERRRANYQRCEELFQKYIEATKGKMISVYLSIKYAYFLHYYLNNMERAQELLQNTKTEDEKLQATVLMALIDLGFRQRDTKLISNTFQQILESSLSPEIKVNFAHRNVEFVEETSKEIPSIMKAHEQLQSLIKLVPPKPNEETPSAVSATDKDVKTDPAAAAAIAASAASYQAATPNVPVTTSDQYNNGANYNNQFASYSNAGGGGWDQAQTNGSADYYNQTQNWGSYQGYYG